MANHLIGKQSKWGFALETGTVGNETEPTVGIPNLNKNYVNTNQTWVEDEKQTGMVVPTTDETTADTISPAWQPQTTVSHPLMGQLLAIQCQSAAEAGAGPYVQTVQPPASNGKAIHFGDTIAAGSLLSCGIKELVGQTGNRDIACLGGIVTRTDVTIPETGRASATVSFSFLDYLNNDDGSGGTYTMPATSIEKMGRDFIYRIGEGTPSALYSKEVTFSLITTFIPHRYGGQGSASNPGWLPYRFICNGWTAEVTFSKPVIAGSDMLTKDFFDYGGETGIDQRLYIYTTGLSDYDEDLSAAGADGDMRWTLNIKIDSVTKEGADELVEQVTCSGKHDGVNNIYKFEQVTALSQSAWAL